MSKLLFSSSFGQSAAAGVAVISTLVALLGCTGKTPGTAGGADATGTGGQPSGNAASSGTAGTEPGQGDGNAHGGSTTTAGNGGAAGGGTSVGGASAGAGGMAAATPTGPAGEPWPIPLTQPITGQWIWQAVDGPANS